MTRPLLNHAAVDASASNLGGAHTTAGYELSSDGGVVEPSSTGFIDRGVEVWAYTVPFDRELVLESLQILASHPALWRSTQSTISALALGKAYLVVDGTDRMELELRARPNQQAQTGANGLLGPFSKPSPLDSWVHLTDGIRFTDANVVAIEWAPYALDADGVQPQRVIGTLVGTDITAGSKVLQHGELVTPGNAARHTVLSYTPPSGHSVDLQSFDVQADAGACDLFNGILLLVDDQIVAELGTAVHQITDTIPAEVVIPFGGVTFPPGTRLSVEARAWVPFGQTISVAIAGATRGVAFPRSRLVNP